tara:strand:+ start:1624 stop:1788 length:165 start_codon:yes stop_codon:yes gene_type:complete
MIILNCIISSAFLLAAGNWLGVGFRARHGRSLIAGAAAMAAGSYFLIAAIGAAV